MCLLASFTHLGRISSNNVALKCKEMWRSTVNNCGILESLNEACGYAIKMWAYKEDEIKLREAIVCTYFFHLIMEWYSMIMELCNDE